MDRREWTVNPNMVVLARESRGLSQKALADQLGIPQSRVSMIEMGVRPTPKALLGQLTEALNFPEHFFYQDGALYGVEIAEVFHRKRRNVPKYTLARIYALVEIRLRHISALLRSLDVATTIPQFDPEEVTDTSKSKNHIADIARTVRAELHLSRGPVEDLTQTLEEAGVIIADFDFGTPLVDALSRWLPALPPTFFVNQQSPKDRYRLSLAHELGHIVMHSQAVPDMEEQANWFAAEFLMPERDILHDLQDLTLYKLTALKRYWRVSMAALLMRAQDLDTITPNQARYLWMQMAKAGYRTREPVELDVTGEQPRLLRELVEMHMDKLGYSESDLGKILPLNEGELHSWYLADGTHPSLTLVR
ncbi:MAG TPA: XRE family transcriptional regulator [Ktedonobacterales bacterium]|jgi:Zn-dependent peptidase ImmA (M78 family)/transcriptional regulator with XRE-family HTH domain